MTDTAVWKTVEIAFESGEDYPNPYLDVDLDVVFTGPESEQVHRPAFWDGGRTWRVRFAPTRPGSWHFQTASKNGSDAGLHGVRGKVECVQVETGLGIYAHGFLRRSDDGRYLAYADGTPFFWLGDTHWRLVLERWDEANKAGWTSQFRGMVDLRVQQGFTVYQTNLMSFTHGSQHTGCWVAGKEFQEIDPGFFQSIVDPRMAYIAEQGLVNALGLAWYQAADEHAAGMARFARYIVARYGAFPVVWTLGGEVAGYDPVLRRQRLDAWREVAHATRAADGYDHPRTAHLTTERPIANYYQGEDWLTFTLNQLGHGDFDMNPAHYLDHFAAYPSTPMVEGESMYEGLTTVEGVARRTVTDTIVRQVAYRAIQSGCCGYTYGAQGCWNNAWDFGDVATMWGDLPWYEGVDLPGAAQMGHLRRFYESFDWTSMRPAPDAFDTTNTINATINPPAVTVAQDGRTVVAYFGETYRTGDGEARLITAHDGPFHLEWFDPRLGRFELIGDRVMPRDGSLAIPDKPDAADWLLIARLKHRG